MKFFKHRYLSQPPQIDRARRNPFESWPISPEESTWRNQVHKNP